MGTAPDPKWTGAEAWEARKMSAQSYDDADEMSEAKRPLRWLPKLEILLKSRFGWWDEAVSPFARACRGTFAAASPPVTTGTMEPAATIAANDDRAAA